MVKPIRKSMCLMRQVFIAHIFISFCFIDFALCFRFNIYIYKRFFCARDRWLLLRIVSKAITTTTIATRAYCDVFKQFKAKTERIREVKKKCPKHTERRGTSTKKKTIASSKIIEL